MTENEQVPPSIEETLDRIPGAFEAVQQGLAEARRGEGIPLDELAEARVPNERVQ